MSRAGQSGFSLVVAIFLLVAVAGLIAYMVNLTAVQHSTLALSVQGARAMQAARSGLDYAVFQVNQPGGTCGDVAASIGFPASAPELEPFTVQLTCNSTNHSEDPVGGSSFDVFELTATAVAGNYIRAGFANPDYVSRQIRATVSPEPP